MNKKSPRSKQKNIKSHRGMQKEKKMPTDLVLVFVELICSILGLISLVLAVLVFKKYYAGWIGTVIFGLTGFLFVFWGPVQYILHPHVNSEMLSIPFIIIVPK